MAPTSNSHPATLALHADDKLNLVTDVAPPIHLSTTFRFPRESENLIPSEDPKNTFPSFVLLQSSAGRYDQGAHGQIQHPQ